MNFRFACSDALIGTKSGIFTKLMDASLEVHVLLRRKHRIWFIRPQIYWHASHPIYTNRNIQVHWGHGVERFGVWGRTLFTSLHIFQGFCVSTGIFVSLYLCVKEIIRAYNSSNWWQAPRHVHMITYWWVACSDRTWCHPWRGSDGCPRLWEMTLPPPKKTTPGDFYYHIRALVYWHNGHQIDMWRHIHVYSGHGVEMFGNRTHYVDGGWQTHSPELYSVESNPILRRGNDRCPKLWGMDDLQRQAPLWQSIAKKSYFHPEGCGWFCLEKMSP